MRYPLRHTRRYTLLLCALISWLATPGYEATAAERVTTRDIIVQATRAEEEAKFESQQKTIITKAEIEKKQAKSVEDIVFNETGVTRTVDSMGRVGVSIRGAEPRHTLILVDGKPVMGDLAKYSGAGDELQRLGTENVDHIEIVQGAASAKYGADAIGGVINVITNKPSKKSGLRFNLEGRREKGDGDISPYSNYFLRADSGQVGKFRFDVYGSKQDIMPVYASRARKNSFLASDEDHGFLKNSLRFYGTNSNVGVFGIYDIDKNRSVSVRADRYKENLERYVKRSDSYVEPQVHYKRDLDRNNMNLTYKAKSGKSNWQAELTYARVKENDITLTSDYGNSTYEGKNTLNYVDNVDHRQWSFDVSADTQINDKHLLSYGAGYANEEGEGSRLKNAPHTYVRNIDPWDYDKSLAVKRGIPSSTVYRHSFAKNSAGVEQWDKEKEWYNGDKNDPATLPQFTYEEYLQYLDPDSGQDPAAVMGLVDGPVTEKTLQKRNPEAYERYKQFARTLLENNREFIEDYHNNKEGRRDEHGNYYPALYDAYLPSFYYGAVPSFDSTKLKLNGAYFKEEYNKRINQVTMGQAKIKKQHFYLQDMWQLNKDTILMPALRLDHSELFGSNMTFNLGMTHNVKGHTHRRFKANIGTSYTEPGMGELYYNWEMYGPNIVNATIGGGEARLGWYWVGNPSLQPEKAVNFDLSLEGESKNTYSKVTLFHNRIKDYMSIYNTGYLMDFYPQYDESTPYGASKFSHAPDLIYSFRNIGKAEITGLEWELKQTLSKHWRARFGYTYLHAVNKSDKDMPRQLLDKPQHKIDIGIDYNDEKSGWSGSLWGDYYINMLDSNSLKGGGNYMVSYMDPTNPDKSVIHYNFNTTRTADMYQRKTFGMWNLMIQKKINKDSVVYFGINNLFNHRDDDRAFSARVYRFGANFKIGSDAQSKNGAMPNDTVVEPLSWEDFLSRPFDDAAEKGVEVFGDYRARWDSHLGSQRPTARVTATSSIDIDAARNLRDEKEHGFENRVRLGVNARVDKNTNIRLVGSASGQVGVDTRHVTEGSQGFSHQRLEEADLTKRRGKWDFSLGRLHESFGVTSYWFGKEFDGGRAVWTGAKSQVKIGFGDFSHSTGVSDSAYTHAVYTGFLRPPTVDEFVGTTLDSDGGRKELVVDNAPNTVNFYQQLKALRDQEAALAKAVDDAKTAAENLESDIWSKQYLDGEPESVLAPLRQQLAQLQAAVTAAQAQYEVQTAPLRERQFEVVRRMRDIAIKAYGSAIAKKTVSLRMPEIQATYSYHTRTYDEDDGQWYDEDNSFNQNIAPGVTGLNTKDPLFEISLADPSLFDENGKVYIDKWYDAHADQIKEAYEKRAKDLGDLTFTNQPYTVTVDTTQLDGLKEKIYKLNSVELPESGTRGTVSVKGSAYYPSLLADCFNEIANVLRQTDGYSTLPREELGKYTGTIIPSQGIVLQRDYVPPIDRAVFVQAKQVVGDKLGLTAWYLRSVGGNPYKAHYAEGRATKERTFTNPANIIGLGATYRLGKKAAVSVDYGQNRSDLGRYLNGHTAYEHTAGTSDFEITGRHDGGTPHFWTLRFDVGKADMKVPGSWSAFADYKYFEHGSFFGGTGATGVPDRYLDGIRSFTLGTAYVPTKNFLLEAFYTFDAKGINRRDTLYGSETFTLGNYTRVQATYKF